MFVCYVNPVTLIHFKIVNFKEIVKKIGEPILSIAYRISSISAKFLQTLIKDCCRCHLKVETLRIFFP